MINSFSGSEEWSHALMVHAINGDQSFVSSGSFRYVFPFALMDFFEQLDIVIDDSLGDDGVQMCETLEDGVMGHVESAINE